MALTLTVVTLSRHCRVFEGYVRVVVLLFFQTKGLGTLNKYELSFTEITWVVGGFGVRMRWIEIN